MLDCAMLMADVFQLKENVSDFLERAMPDYEKQWQIMYGEYKKGVEGLFAKLEWVETVHEFIDKHEGLTACFKNWNFDTCPFVYEGKDKETPRGCRNGEEG